MSWTIRKPSREGGVLDSEPGDGRLGEHRGAPHRIRLRI
jgi:hypothetical protein